MFQTAVLVFALALSFLALKGQHPFVPGLISLLLLIGLLFSHHPIQPLRNMRTGAPLGLIGLLLLLCWYALSLLWSQAGGVTLEFLAAFAALPIAALLAASLSWQQWQKLMLVTGGISVAVALHAIAQGIAGEVERPPGLFMHPNHLAGFLLLFLLPTIAGTAASREKLHLILYGGATCILTAALVLTQSRGALLALLASFIILVFLGKSWRVQPLRFVIGIVAIGMVAGSLLNSGATGERIANSMEISDPSSYRSANPRPAIWAATLDMYSDHPWLGWGGGSFKLAYPAYRPPGFSPEIVNAHNDYLQVLAELGPIGVALLLLGIVAPLFAGGRASRKGGARAPLYAGTTAGLFALSLQMLVTSNLYTPSITLLIGIYVGRLASSAEATTAASGRKTDILARGLMILLLFQLGSILMGKYYLQQSLNVSSTEERLALLQAASRWNPVDDVPHYFAARVLHDRIGRGVPDQPAALAAAMKELDKAGELAPLRRQTYWLRARLLQREQPISHQAIARNYQTVLRLNPKFLLARIDYAHFLRQQGMTTQACDVLQAGLTQRYYSRRSSLLSYTRALSNCQKTLPFPIGSSSDIKSFIEKHLNKLRSSRYELLFYTFIQPVSVSSDTDQKPSITK